MEKINVSKSSLSVWLRGIQLTTAQKKLLSDRSLVQGKLGGERKKQIWDAIRKEVSDSYCPPIVDPFFLLGLGLYWGEGTKHNKSTTSVSNADGSLLKCFISWIKKFFAGDFERFSVTVHHYCQKQDQNIKKHWSKLLGLSLDNFTKSVLSVSKSGKMKKGKTLPFGTAHVTVCGVGSWKVRQKIGKALDILADGHLYGN